MSFVGILLRASNPFITSTILSRNFANLNNSFIYIYGNFTEISKPQLSILKWKRYVAIPRERILHTVNWDLPISQSAPLPTIQKTLQVQTRPLSDPISLNSRKSPNYRRIANGCSYVIGCEAFCRIYVV
jgi:hypothetical protein